MPRAPRVVVVFVLLEILQPAAMVAVGGLSFSSRGLPVMMGLTLWLAYGSMAAWVLLVAITAVPTLGVLAMIFGSGGETSWGNAIVAAVTGGLLTATLLSPAMRRHIGIGGRRISPSAVQ